MKLIHMVAFVLVTVGAINWLMVGAFQWDVGMLLGGTAAMLSRIIYILIGLAGVYLAVTHKKDCKECVTPATM